MESGRNKLPNFLIVGAAKAGTTSIAKYLDQHPDIFIPENKELRFLIHDTIENLNDLDPLKKGILKKSILNFEDYCQAFEHNEKCLGEASVHYLYHYSETIKNINKFLQEPKIIIILRNPVVRAISNYEYLSDTHSRSFSEELFLEDERITLNYNSFWFYKRLGLYYEQVKAYLESFNHVHVIIFEEFIKDKQGHMNSLFKFLELPSIEINFEIYNKTKKHSLFRKKINKIGLYHIFNIIFTKKQKDWLLRKFDFFLIDKNRLILSDVEKNDLINFYKNDIEKLESLLDIELSSWKR
jgi:hypothetical protein